MPEVLREFPNQRIRFRMNSQVLGYLVPLITAMVVVVNQWAAPNHLSGVSAYDDGVYFGASLALLDRALPYVDYTFVHPPGIILVLLPFAWLGEFTGTSAAWAVARVAFGVFAVANVGLAAHLVRRHGVAAMWVSGTIIALFPLNVSATHTTLLETALALLLLLGLSALFGSNGHLNDRTFLSGLLFGFALMIKLTAAAVIIPVVLLLVAKRTPWLKLHGLLAGGFLAVALCVIVPLLLDPIAIFDNTIGAQLGRAESVVWGFSIPERLVLLTGIADFPRDSVTGLAVVLTLLVILLVSLTWFIHRGELRELDWALLIAAASCATFVLLVPTDFYRYYVYLPVVFLSPVIAVTIACLLPKTDLVQPIRKVLPLALIAVSMICVILLSWTLPYGNHYLSTSHNEGALISSIIPQNACVAHSSLAPLISGNRVSRDREDCPLLVDPFGEIIRTNDGRTTNQVEPFAEGLVSKWVDRINKADYVLLPHPRSSFVPWQPPLDSMFRERFVLTASGIRTFIFERSIPKNVVATFSDEFHGPEISNETGQTWRWAGANTADIRFEGLDEHRRTWLRFSLLHPSCGGAREVRILIDNRFMESVFTRGWSDASQPILMDAGKPINGELNLRLESSSAPCMPEDDYRPLSFGIQSFKLWQE